MARKRFNSGQSSSSSNAGSGANMLTPPQSSGSPSRFAALRSAAQSAAQQAAPGIIESASQIGQQALLGAAQGLTPQQQLEMAKQQALLQAQQKGLSLAQQQQQKFQAKADAAALASQQQQLQQQMPRNQAAQAFAPQTLAAIEGVSANLDAIKAAFQVQECAVVTQLRQKIAVHTAALVSYSQIESETTQVLQRAQQQRQQMSTAQNLTAQQQAIAELDVQIALIEKLLKRIEKLRTQEQSQIDDSKSKIAKMLESSPGLGQFCPSSD